MGREGVILLHGIARSSAAMRKLERALDRAGYKTLNLDYPARRHDIATLAETVAEDAASVIADADRVHFVTHSMGGLVARALIRQRRPKNLGRVVMLGPPNQGSEIADLLERRTLYRRAFGPAGAELTTQATESAAQAERIDYSLGIIAGTRAIDPISWLILPKPNDGKVSVERTRLAGMADHIVIPATHSLMMRNEAVIRAVLAFLRNGHF